VAFIQHRSGKASAVSRHGGSELRFKGENLAETAPPGKENLVPGH
jgi:hypothetical protein